jgi:Ni/Fe-hydrogenase subunit HybB-like protein
VGRAFVIVFLAVRFADIAYRGVGAALLEPSTVSIMLWIETFFFVASVALLAGHGGARAQRIFLAAMSMAIGGILYRIDAYLVAYDTGAGWRYFPSIGELATTIGLIAVEILGFIIAIRLLPVLPKQSDARAESAA